MDEHMEDSSTIPSASKELIVAFLESDERSVKVLTNVLKFKVRDLVSNYELCYGQVPLGTWKYVLQQLGYSERQLVPAQADQMIADATDIADIDGLEENGCDDFSLQAAAENGPSHRSNIIPSTVQSLSEGNSSPLGLGPVDKNERSHHENSTGAEIEGREENLAASSVQADHKQQSIGKTSTPSRPTTPETPRSTHDPVVTGQRGSRQNNAMDKPYPPRNGEESGNLSKNATENDCYRGESDCIGNNNGPYAELQKIIRQQDERNVRANYQVVMLKKENEELSEELRTAIGKIQHVEKQRLDNEQKLQEEHGKFQSWKEKMTEEFKGFQESKRKQVEVIEGKLTKGKRKIKRMKIQLAREKNQRKRVERELERAKRKEKKMEKRNDKKMEDLKRNESFLVQDLREKNAQLQNCQAQKIGLQQELEHIEQHNQKFDECNGDLENLQKEYEEQQEKMEDLKQNESFLVQDLREKTAHLENCLAQYIRLQQDFEECRAELQSVQTSNAELQRRFQESTQLIAESHELCRKAGQMYLWKEQECERMKEHIEQHNQKYDECNGDLENLQKEYEDQQEELHSAVEMVQELQREFDNRQKLLDEREYDLDRRMVEMSQESCKAETDRMKIMKVKLAEAIRQRKKMKRQLAKERNKRKRLELEKAIEKRRGKRMEKRKKEDTGQCFRKKGKGDDPSGGTRGGYGGHVSRDEGDLSSIASSDEESNKTEVTTCPDDSTGNEDTK